MTKAGDGIKIPPRGKYHLPPSGGQFSSVSAQWYVHSDTIHRINRHTLVLDGVPRYWTCGRNRPISLADEAAHFKQQTYGAVKMLDYAYSQHIYLSRDHILATPSVRAACVAALDNCEDLVRERVKMRFFCASALCKNSHTHRVNKPINNIHLFACSSAIHST